jgi:LAO/AO transport system kinase
MTARELARAITTIENRGAGAQRLLREIFPKTGRALVVGITGPPGAGKSTLVSALIAALRREGKRVAVLAVDPTSPFSGGAILGDRIRMLEHNADPGVFIRSLATRGALGGIAAAVANVTLLLDAAGFDVILVETVGVGQDEIDIARVAQVTVVVLVPNLGDDVQALKAGILEIADVFALNKADLPGFDKLQREIEPSGVPVIPTVATRGDGVEELLTAIRSVSAAGTPGRRAALHWEFRLREMLRERLLGQLDLSRLPELARRVAERELDPYTAVDEILRRGR